MADHAFVLIDGHRVDPGKVDLFFNHDGTRVSDEQWDETTRRIREAEANPAAITWQPIADYEAGAPA